MNRLNPLGSALIKLGGTALSRHGRRASLAILIFHRVLPRQDPLLPDEPDARRFAAVLDLLQAEFRVLPLREAVHHLASSSLPSRSVSITFDDGYANNCEVALPLLAERQLPATVFVANGFLNGGIMFNDLVIESVRNAPKELDLGSLGLGQFALTNDQARQKAATEIIGALKYLSPKERYTLAEDLARLTGVTPPTDLMMTDEQVVRLHAAGIEIGAHTVSHPILSRVDAETARTELLQSKRDLSDLTGRPVTALAYPNGAPERDYGSVHARLARDCGFEMALSTAWGTATASADVYQLPRIAPWDRGAFRFGARIVRAYAQREFNVARPRAEDPGLSGPIPSD
jgi:peptidoglycan/xylan/chitin deacetylase (PgdA/CDA1 family)